MTFDELVDKLVAYGLCNNLHPAPDTRSLVHGHWRSSNEDSARLEEHLDSLDREHDLGLSGFAFQSVMEQAVARLGGGGRIVEEGRPSPFLLWTLAAVITGSLTLLFFLLWGG